MATTRQKNAIEIVQEEISEKLTLKQEMFCQYYAGSTEFFGNGLQSYAKAYSLDLSKKGAVNTAKANAWKLLTNTYILRRINELLEELQLNDEHVDKQMGFVITQNADLRAKVAAIKEYNSLRKRVNRGEDSRSIFAFILNQIQNGSPRIVTSDFGSTPGSQGDTGQTQQPLLEAEQSVLDQR